jgi:GxxExxY protein
VTRGELIDDKLTDSVIGAFYEVYNVLGFGFLEHVYIAAMERELRSRNHLVHREVGVRVRYKGDHLCSYRLDMLIDERLIVEVKSSPTLPPTVVRQLHNYLKATDLELGLILHFGPEPMFYRRILTNDKKAFRSSARASVSIREDP